MAREILVQPLERGGLMLPVSIFLHYFSGTVLLPQNQLMLEFLLQIIFL